jgi:hypothetical protein
MSLLTETNYNKTDLLHMLEQNNITQKNLFKLLKEYTDVETQTIIINSEYIKYLFGSLEVFKNEAPYIIKHIISILYNSSVIQILFDYISNNEFIFKTTTMYVTCFLFKNDLISKGGYMMEHYNINPQEMILYLFHIGYNINVMKYIINKYSSFIYTDHMRDWIFIYIGRNNDIELIKFLENTYYIFSYIDIFNILFNYSAKEITISQKLYNFIFSNYTDIIKNEKESFEKLICALNQDERHDLIYIILSNIQFNNEDLVRICDNVFKFNDVFFEELASTISDIFKNNWNMTNEEIKRIYIQVNNHKLIDYVNENL